MRKTTQRKPVKRKTASARAVGRAKKPRVKGAPIGARFEVTRMTNGRAQRFTWNFYNKSGVWVARSATAYRTLATCIGSINGLKRTFRAEGRITISTPNSRRKAK